MSERQQAMEQQHRNALEQSSHSAAVRAAAEKEQKYLQNPEFLGQLQDPDADSDVFDWVEDELGPELSGAHILGQRGDHYEEQQELLNRNVVNRLSAERNPGRLLKNNPMMLAQAQGAEATEQYPDPTEHPKYREPLTSRKKRVTKSAAEIITNRQTLSIGGRGVDAVSTATVENRTVTDEREEKTKATDRIKGVFS